MQGRETGNPFVGLRPFEADESVLFFGRREQTAELLERLFETRFLAVVGSSGCGKSSLIRAGLIPALLGGFLVEDRDRWVTATMKPGDAPLANLAAALCKAAGGDVGSDVGPDDIRAVHQALEEDPGEVERRAAAVVGKDSNLLLLVDQFEEIFSFRGKEDEDSLPERTRDERRDHARRHAEAAEFVDLMLRLAQVDAPVYVVMTMRTDFLGDCDVFRGLPEAINLSGYMVPRLDREQLRQAIEGPARLSGARLAPRLRDLLLNKLGDRSDRLPVLQHALLRTWDLWNQNGEGETIDLAHYRKAGTLSDALSQHANEALREEDAELTATLFKSLTDTDSNHRRVRRPVHLSELVAVSGAESSAVEAVLERFCEGGRNFLVISDSAGTGDPRIDISHESLIRQWDQLKRWVDEERESRDQFLDIAECARRHDKGGALLQEDDLRLFQSWWQKARPSAEWAGRYCQRAGDFDKAKDYLEASRREVDAAAMLRRRNRKIVAGATIATVLALAAITIWALSQRARADRARALTADALRHADASLRQAELNLALLFEEKGGTALWFAARDEESGESPAEEYQEAWLYTLAALTHVQAANDELPVSLGRLLLGEMRPSRNWASPVEETTAPVVGLTFRDNAWLAATLMIEEREQALYIRVPSEEPRLVHKTDETAFWGRAAFSRDARMLAAGLSDGRTLIWSTPEGKKLLGPRKSDPVVSLAFSRNGSRLASGFNSGKVIVRDLSDQAGPDIQLDLESGSTLSSVAFGSDERTLATGQHDGTVCRWKLEPIGRVCHRLDEAVIADVAFRPGHDDSLAVGTQDGVWNWTTGKEPHRLAGDTDRVTCVVFNPDGTLLATGHADGLLRLWEVERNRLLATVPAHTASVATIIFAKDGNTLFSGSSDRTVRRIDLQTDVLDGTPVDFRALLTEADAQKREIGDFDRSSREKMQYELLGTEFVGESTETIDSASATYYAGATNPLEFTPSNVVIRGNASNEGYPRFVDDQIVLTPDQQQDRAGVVLLKTDVEPPFRISFEYSIRNELYPQPWNSRWKTADGIVLMFLKDRGAYDAAEPPAGGKTGFIADGTGYGVQFRTFENRSIRLFAEDPQSVPLREWEPFTAIPRKGEKVPAGDVYTGGEWRSVTVEVGARSVTVIYEGLPVIRWSGGLDTDRAGIGFGAATGGEVSEHRIRNVRLEQVNEDQLGPIEQYQSQVPPTLARPPQAMSPRKTKK